MTSRSERARSRYLWADPTAARTLATASALPSEPGRRTRRDTARRADPDLPRLPAARHREQRVQREPRAGAGEDGARGAHPVPGPGGRRASLRRCDRALGGRGAATSDRPPSGWVHCVPPRHRRGPAGLRRRRLRGVPGRSLSGPRRRRSRPLPGGERRRGPRRLRPRAAEGRAREPPGHGPGDPRSRPRRHRSLRGQGARQRPRVHGAAPPRALPPLRPGGARAGRRRAGGLAPHRGEPLGGGGRDRPPGPDPPRPARGRRGSLPPAVAGRRRRAPRGARRAPGPPGRRSLGWGAGRSSCPSSARPESASRS